MFCVISVLSAMMNDPVTPSSHLSPLQFASNCKRFVCLLSDAQAFVSLGAGKSQVVQVQTRGGLKVIFGMPSNSSWEADIIRPDIATSNGNHCCVSRARLSLPHFEDRSNSKCVVRCEQALCIW